MTKEIELVFKEFFMVCAKCWKHGPSGSTIESAVELGRKQGWVYVKEIQNNVCPECSEKEEI